MGKDIVNTWFLKGGATAQDLGCVLHSGNGVLVEYGIISIGYWLQGKDRKNYDKVHNRKEYMDYYQLIYNEENKKPNITKTKTWDSSPQAQLYDRLKKGDIVWTRVSGSKYPDIEDGYYVAIVPDDPANLFYCNGLEHGFDDLEKADCLVGINGIEWHGPFSEDAVPGSVSRYIQGKTLVCADRIEENNPVYDLDNNKWTYTSTVSYLMFYGDDRKPPVVFKKKNINCYQDKLEFFNLIGWRGLEDVSAFWLQNNEKEKLFLQPSTCKSGTPGYEYVLIEPISGKKIFVQTKNSPKNTMNEDDYRKKLIGDDDEFYLISTGKINSEPGKIVILKKNNQKTEKELEELVNFVFDSTNDTFLPKHIVYFKKKIFDL